MQISNSNKTQYFDYFIAKTREREREKGRIDWRIYQIHKESKLVVCGGCIVALSCMREMKFIGNRLVVNRPRSLAISHTLSLSPYQLDFKKPNEIIGN